MANRSYTPEEKELRDRLAESAMKAFLTDLDVYEEFLEEDFNMIAKLSYKIADAMITNRRKL